MNSEQFISDYLSNLGLRPERFSKSEMRVPNQKSPDFKVFQGDTLELYCEVKEVIDAEPLEKIYQEVAPGILGAAQLGYGKSPNNRLVRKIEDAVEKFRCINRDRTHLNVLAVVNTYDHAAPEDLLALLQGFLRIESGSRYAIAPQCLLEQVKQVIWEIDLYWWIEHRAFEKTPKHYWLSPHAEDSSTFFKLRKLFHMDGNSQPAQL